MKFPIALFLVVIIFIPLIGQNLSPSLSLVFLGIKSIALPLGVWVALAGVAGAITAGTISLLQSRSNSTRPSKSRQRRSVSPPPQEPELGNPVTPKTVDPLPRQSFGNTDEIEVEYASVRNSPMRDKANTSQPSGEEIWDEDEEWESEEPTNGAVETDDDNQNRRVVEVQKEPISSNRQGSIYSYSYRSPEDVRMASPELEDDEEDEETLDLRDIPPPPPIDPFPTLEVIDPIVEPETPRGFTQEKRSSPQPQPQNQNEDDWGEGSHNNDEDW
jgi:uncharacterized integral membrane protein